MNEHVNNEIDQSGPLGYAIRETVTTTGYVDREGKFVPVDEVQTREDSEEVIYVQDEEDVIR